MITVNYNDNVAFPLVHLLLLLLARSLPRPCNVTATILFFSASHARSLKRERERVVGGGQTERQNKKVNSGRERQTEAEKEVGK